MSRSGPSAAKSNYKCFLPLSNGILSWSVIDQTLAVRLHDLGLGASLLAEYFLVKARFKKTSHGSLQDHLKWFVRNISQTPADLTLNIVASSSMAEGHSI